MNSNEFEKVIIDNVKDIRIDVFSVNDDNRNWFVTFWKIRIAILNVDRFIIQFFDHVCYNSKRESIKEKRKRAR